MMFKRSVHIVEGTDKEVVERLRKMTTADKRAEKTWYTGCFFWFLPCLDHRGHRVRSKRSRLVCRSRSYSGRPWSDTVCQGKEWRYR